MSCPKCDERLRTIDRLRAHVERLTETVSDVRRVCAVERTDKLYAQEKTKAALLDREGWLCTGYSIVDRFCRTVFVVNISVDPRNAKPFNYAMARQDADAVAVGVSDAIRFPKMSQRGPYRVEPIYMRADQTGAESDEA